MFGSAAAIYGVNLRRLVRVFLFIIVVSTADLCRNSCELRTTCTWAGQSGHEAQKQVPGT